MLLCIYSNNKNKQEFTMSHHSLMHHISFKPVDPLGDGLREDILAEQLEPEAIVLEEVPSEDALGDYLESITADIQQDSEKLTYSEE